MKKQYVKPMIAVEQYVLSQTIATCFTKIGFQNSTCVLKDSDAPHQMKNLAARGYFTQQTEGGCDLLFIGMDESDGICYHTNANAAFNS